MHLLNSRIYFELIELKFEIDNFNLLIFNRSTLSRCFDPRSFVCLHLKNSP